MLGALVGAHGQHAFERPHHRLGVAGGEQVGQILHRDAQLVHVRDFAIAADLAGIGGGGDRRQRRHVPHHGQRAVFRVQRQRHLPLHRHLVHRAAAGGFHPRIGDAVGARLFDHVRIVRVEEDVELRLVEVAVVFDRGRFLDAVCVIQQHAEVADAADAGFRAHGGLAGLDARVAEDALLGLAALPVVVDLLVRAAGHAHAPAAALVLVDQHDAVLFALVDRAGRAAGDAGRVQAVLAQPRQVHHEGVLELAVDVLLHPFEILEVPVLRALREFAAENLFPVRAPLDLFHALTGDQAARPSGRRRLHFRRRLQVVVVEGEGLVVVVDFRQVRVGEDFHQQLPLAALARHDGAVGTAHPAALPLVLVLPFLRVADAGLGFDVVEPGVFHAGPAGPHVLAGDRTGVAADALVEIEHHADLCAYFHVISPYAWAVSVAASPSSQSTRFILRTTTNSSRLVPMVP